MKRKIHIIGNGKMAKAIAKGMMDSFEVVVVGRDRQKLAALRTSLAEKVEIETLEEEYDICDKDILLCVKPYALHEIASKMSGEASSVISSLAGVELTRIEAEIPAQNYVRIMPNLAAEYGKSMTTLCGDSAIETFALSITESFGSSLWLGSEKELDIATAVAGSGPAFLALTAEAISDGAVKAGLKREDAHQLVDGLFEGFSSLLTHKHPAMIKEEVMSPGGTTAEGLCSLESASVRAAFIDAVNAAYDKTQKI
jgi:pyrroline-5-carboxylate reductase